MLSYFVAPCKKTQLYILPRIRLWRIL